MSELPSGFVTLVFTDIEGSTWLLQNLGSEYDAVLHAHYGLLREVWQRRGGCEVSTEGDAFFVVFARPDNAVLAAVDAQRAMASHEWPHGAKVRVRIGMHTGEVELHDRQYVGLAVHQAARVAAAAHGGQVLVSRETRDAVRLGPNEVTFMDLGVHRLKDIAAPAQLYHVKAVGLESSFPVPRTLTSMPNNFPIAVTSFVGHQDDVERVRAALTESRLVTLVGTGGVGKTRLAIEVGRETLEEFPDGAWLVDLTGLSDPNLVPAATAEAVGVREQFGRPVVETLVDHLISRRSLIIMDNCEHLIAACAALVDRLLASDRDVKVLATSRETLNVPGEFTWRVRSLSVPSEGEADLHAAAATESVRLFVERAQWAEHGFELGEDNLGPVVSICRRLDGVPLAIELAAARLRSMGIADIAARLDDRFRLLTRGSRTALPRQQTLEATVNWSYELLAPTERLLFDRLSVFAGGFTLEAAERVCAEDGVLVEEVLDLTSRLAERSMVTVERSADERTRYGLLETLRQFARQKLVEQGADEVVRNRHLEWAVEFAQAATTNEQLAEEDDNLRAALDWAIDTGAEEAALRIARRHPTRHVGEYARRYELLLPPSPAVPAQLAGEVLSAAGGLAFMMGEWSLGADRYASAAAAGRVAGDRGLTSFALTYQGFCVLGMDRDEEVLPLLEKGLAEARAGGNPEAEARALMALAWLYSESDLERAETTAREGIQITEQLSGVFDRGHLIEVLGFVLGLQGRFDLAAEQLADAASLFKRIVPGCAAHILETGATFAAMTDQWELGAELLGAAARIRHETADKPRPWERAVRTRWLPLIPTRLDPATYEAATGRGGALGRLQALEFAGDRLRASWAPTQTARATGPTSR